MICPANSWVADFWQKWRNQSNKRQLYKEKSYYYPVSRGPSIFLDKSIDGPLLLGQLNTGSQ